MLDSHVTQGAEFAGRVSTLPVEVNALVSSPQRCQNVGCLKLVRAVTGKAAKQKQSIEKPMFVCSTDAVLPETGTEQMRRDSSLVGSPVIWENGRTR